jgi:hypothetical protein
MTGLVALIVMARLWLVFHRLYDPDELQHLHAGYCVWKGMVPYRDFFEQHEPVLWYVSLPLFRICGPTLDVLTAGRFIIWLVGAASIALVWVLGTRLYGRWGGPVAALLLLLLPSFQEKNMEWRPDNIAVPLILLATWAATEPAGFGAVWRAGLFGAALAAGFFCTQKVAYIGLGLGAGFVATTITHARNLARAMPQTGSIALARRTLTTVLPRIAAAFGGAMLVAATVLLLFAAQGAVGPFIEMTILVPLRWKTHEPMLRFVLKFLAESPVFAGAAAAGFILSLAEARESIDRRSGEWLVIAGVAAHVAGLFFVPAAFLQYYLPLLPLTALLATRALLELAGWIPSTVKRGARLGALLAGLAASTVALVAAFTVSPFGVGWSAVIATVCAACILIALVARRVAVLGLLVATLLAASPFLAIQYGRWSQIGRDQKLQIERLMRATEPGDRFFDCFSGYGALRPHAFFYYWINDHSWPMIPDDQRHTGVLDALADPRTRVVIADTYLYKHLPIEAKQYIVDNFEADSRFFERSSSRTAPGLMVLVRRGREFPPEIP